MGHLWTTLIFYFKKIVVGSLKPTLWAKIFDTLSSIIITKYKYLVIKPTLHIIFNFKATTSANEGRGEPESSEGFWGSFQWIPHSVLMRHMPHCSAQAGHWWLVPSVLFWILQKHRHHRVHLFPKQKLSDWLFSFPFLAGLASSCQPQVLSIPNWAPPQLPSDESRSLSSSLPWLWRVLH